MLGHSVFEKLEPCDSNIANAINIYPAAYPLSLPLTHQYANQEQPVPTPHKKAPVVEAGAVSEEIEDIGEDLGEELGEDVGEDVGEDIGEDVSEEVGEDVDAMMGVVSKGTCLKHECKQCGEQFNQERSLTQHALVHKLVKNFECHECGRQFLKKSKSDTPSRKAVARNSDCARHRDSSSPTSVDLRKHSLGHNGLECDQCGKQFANNGNLKRHLLLHTGVKDYKCSDCGKEFTQKAHLDQHALSHSGVKNFKCEECGALFSRKGNLARHKQIHA